MHQGVRSASWSAYDERAPWERIWESTIALSFFFLFGFLKIEKPHKSEDIEDTDNENSQRDAANKIRSEKLFSMCKSMVNRNLYREYLHERVLLSPAIINFNALKIVVQLHDD